jgi:hypothetical protein
MSQNIKKQRNQILLFADDHVMMAVSENLLQKLTHKLEIITSEYGLTISTNKTEIMAF